MSDSTGITPRFSIVVPCFNEAAYLPATLRSLREQDYSGSYEIIVVDNNCTDATANIAREFGARVVVEPHRGVCWARQGGTAASRGEIVVSVDADTTYGSGWLTTIDAHFQADPRVVAVAGPCRYVGGPGWGRWSARALFGAVQSWYRCTGRTAYASATNIAFRRNAFPGYDVRLTQGGDELYVLHTLRRRGRIVYDHTNPTFTSSRRLTRGAGYGLFVTVLLYYVLGYHLNRALGRTVIGTAPAFREEVPRRTWRLGTTSGALVAALVLTVVAVRVV